jgi:hypothetical protein
MKKASGKSVDGYKIYGDTYISAADKWSFNFGLNFRHTPFDPIFSKF